MKIANLTLGPEITRVGEFSYLALVGLQPLMIALNTPGGGGGEGVLAYTCMGDIIRCVPL